ncbi:hypothetical protein GLAREA_03742 [Glarea lozoyensis ATCC 20868]|uniref:Uncharacterized protein n=1 Tax=Glarea lozoyensis (strain ATCC 20868 / MF5171) TaxID=1116229 RepID=S3CYY8_GLAL2|nr:uncharacterized protein GLAREA_03742 [Glarea lozoyensis ATCC 20868]EPE30775.1 hypothetical protein GLAREA_03742 [Glarea lozoyensis ATCC 20868]
MRLLVLKFLSIAGLLHTAICAPAALDRRDTKSLLLRSACSDESMTAVTVHYEDEKELPEKTVVRSLGKDCATILPRIDKKITKYTVDQANSKLGELTLCHLKDSAGQTVGMSSDGVGHFSNIHYHLAVPQTVWSVWCEEIEMHAERFVIRTVVRDTEQST